MQNAVLTAVASRDILRANAYAAKYNIPFAYTYDELYNSKEVDAIYISTTHNFHFEHCMQCILHGKAVLCEKPITLNVDEFEKLVKFSTEKQVFLMEGMWTYFLPAIQKAQQWLAAGRIGALKVIQADFSYPMEKKLEGRFYDPNLAGGALLDLGVYTVALATLFMNRKPKHISANAVFTETGVDATTSMVFQYGDVTAMLFTSIETRTTNRLRLFGEKGYIEFADFWRANSALLFDEEHLLVDVFEDGRTSHGFIYEMQHATDRILSNELESNVIPLHRSNEIQEILTDVRRQIGLKYPNE